MCITFPKYFWKYNTYVAFCHNVTGRTVVLPTLFSSSNVRSLIAKSFQTTHVLDLFSISCFVFSGVDTVLCFQMLTTILCFFSSSYVENNLFAMNCDWYVRVTDPLSPLKPFPFCHLHKSYCFCQLQKSNWFCQLQKSYWFCHLQKSYWFCQLQKSNWFCHQQKLQIQFRAVATNLLSFYSNLISTFQKKKNMLKYAKIC